MSAMVAAARTTTKSARVFYSCASVRRVTPGPAGRGSTGGRPASGPATPRRGHPPPASAPARSPQRARRQKGWRRVPELATPSLVMLAMMLLVTMCPPQPPPPPPPPPADNSAAGSAAGSASAAWPRPPPRPRRWRCAAACRGPWCRFRVGSPPRPELPPPREWVRGRPGAPRPPRGPTAGCALSRGVSAARRPWRAAATRSRAGAAGRWEGERSKVIGRRGAWEGRQQNGFEGKRLQKASVRQMLAVQRRWRGCDSAR